MADGGAQDRLTLDERDCVTGEEVIPGLAWLGGHAWVGKLHALAEFQVVILPGAESICRLS